MDDSIRQDAELEKKLDELSDVIKLALKKKEHSDLKAKSPDQFWKHMFEGSSHVRVGIIERISRFLGLR